MKPSFVDYVRTVRDISYDNYLQPAFMIYNKTDKGLRLNIDDEKLQIVDELNLPLVRQLYFFGRPLEEFDPFNTDKVFKIFLPQSKSSEPAQDNMTWDAIVEPPSEIDDPSATVSGNTITVEVPNFVEAGPPFIYTIEITYVNDTDISEVSLNGTPYAIFTPQFASSGHTIKLYGDRSKFHNNLSIETFGDADITVVSKDYYQTDPTTGIETSVSKPTDAQLSSDNNNYYKTIYTVEISDGTSTVTYVIDLDYAPAPILLAVEQDEFTTTEPLFPGNENGTFRIARDYRLAQIFSVETMYSETRASLEVTFESDYLLTGIDYEYKTAFGEVILSGKIRIKFIAPPNRDVPPHVLRQMYFDDFSSLGEFVRGFSSNADILFTEYWPTLVQVDIPSILNPMHMVPIPNQPEEFQEEDIADDELGGLEDLTPPLVVGRRKFFSDDYVVNKFREYFRYFRSRFYTTTEKVIEEVEGLPEQTFAHICLWAAFYLVEDRRLYEAAAEMLVGLDDQLSIAGGSSFGAQRSPNMRMTLNIGSAFTLEEGGPEFNASAGRAGGAPAQYGADNVLGDEDSFWYRLQAVIRKRFEDIYRQPHLRSNEIIEGIVEAMPTNDRNFLAFFDSFPHTLSPYSRGIFGGSRTSIGGTATRNRVL